jgi:hypothetical protein
MYKNLTNNANAHKAPLPIAFDCVFNRV